MTALLISAVFFPQLSYTQEDVIRLVFAEDVINSEIHKNTTVAKGNVEFKHKGARLFCDSALFFQDLNLVHAFSNVQINQGDTVNLFCDSLKYNGKTNISKLISNVRFRDNEYLMLTDSLDYNGNTSIGKYTNWAKISSINSDLKLTSKKGYYYSTTKTFFFKDSVHVEDENYDLFSDTLEFRTQNTSAHFHGPTKILFDSTIIDCQKGIYYSETEQVELWNGATINEPQRTFYADSLIYNRKEDIGTGYCNVRLYDSTETVLFLSDYLHKLPKNQKIILKEDARIVQYSDKDTLFLQGDTITYYQDTLSKNQRSIIENNVSIINSNIFIRCDSAYFSEQDSILKLHKKPLMWSEENQLNADSIFATYYDKEFHEMYLYHNAMIVSEHENDTIHYNQIKGKFMTAYLDSNDIKKIHVEGNTQTLYYPTETKKDSSGVETKRLSAMNKIDCLEIEVRFKKGEIQTISFLDHPISIYYPLDQIPTKELFLNDFSWQIDRKPVRPFIE